MSVPFTIILPSVGSTSLSKRRIKVDLPEPEEPTTNVDL